MAKRNYEIDADRIAETIWQDHKRNIVDKATFDKAFDVYMEGSGEELRSSVFKHLVSNHPQVTKKDIFKEAGGKDFNRDKRTTAKRIVTSRKGYIQAGASNVDLKGYDTRTFDVRGKVGGKIVFARPEVIKYSKIGNKQKFRDKRGRFVKVRGGD